MNPPTRSRAAAHRERGSVLVVCMVLAALGTIGVAAWFSLLDARGHQVEASLRGLERRVAVANGRALAHRALYGRYLHGNETSGSNLVYQLPDAKGRATLSPFAIVPLRSDAPGPAARNGATPLASNFTLVSVDVANGSGSLVWSYLLRNCHPAAAGNLLAMHAPANPTDSAPLISGNLHVKGRAVFWDATAADLSNGLRAEEFSLPGRTAGNTTFSTPSNTSTLPLNYPNYLRTAGTTSAGPSYRGELELLSASVNPQNSYEARLQTSPYLQLDGDVAQSDGTGPAESSSLTDDSPMLEFIGSSTPAQIAQQLSAQPSISSAVMIAAITKFRDFAPDDITALVLEAFASQTFLPDDVLTELMEAVDETSLTRQEDDDLLEFIANLGARYTNNGRGSASLFIARLDLPELKRVVLRDVTRLRLIGQSGIAMNAAATTDPVLIIIDNRGGTQLAAIDLFGENERPLIVVAASAPASPALPVTTFRGDTDFPVFRAVLELQNTGLAVDLGEVGGATLSGGIRGNHRITVADGTLTLDRDPAISVLAPLLSREAWIETVTN
jgi:hypothetical protein